MQLLQTRWLLGLLVGCLLLLGAAVRVAAGELPFPPQRNGITVTAVTASPMTASGHEFVAISAAFRSHGAVHRNLTIDLDVRRADGTLVFRATRRGVHLENGGSQTVQWVWRRPEQLTPGQYHVDISVYGPNWSPLYLRATDVATFAPGQMAQK